MSEPLFSCQIDACRAEVSYPRADLRLLHGKPICHECYDNSFELQIPKTFDEDGDPDEMLWWSDLPPFVPEHDKRIAELMAENRRLKKDVVEARHWAEKWQGLAHELGADIQQAAEVLAHFRALVGEDCND